MDRSTRSQGTEQQAAQGNQHHTKSLAVGIITYNDAPSLRRCIDSVIDNVDKIFVVDGRYPDYDDGTENKFSTDGTQEVCKKFGRKVEYHQLFAEQHIKRSRYLDLAKQYDFLLVLDAEDYVIGSNDEHFPEEQRARWHLFRWILDTHPLFHDHLLKYHRHAHNVPLLLSPTELTQMGRLIYRPYELYYSNHWKLMRKVNGQMQKYQETGEPNNIHDAITIAYDDNLRTDSRLEQDIDYQWMLYYKEGTITEEMFHDPVRKGRFAAHLEHEVNLWRDPVDAKRWRRDRTMDFDWGRPY